MNNTNKIPSIPCIILTTSEEMDIYNKKVTEAKFLPYSKTDNFKEYLLKVISAYRSGYKEFYSELLFSIDPGEKSGLMVFLDGYYLVSHCCYTKKDLLYKISRYVYYFQKNNPELIKLTFKFGRGILKMAQELVQDIINMYINRDNMHIFLIDEFKSSKIKINNRRKEKKISKDEASALILALRNGIEVDQNNLENIFNKIRSSKFKKKDFKFKKSENSHEEASVINDIVKKILNGKLSLYKSIEIIKQSKLNNNYIL
ncbi:MAG: hypothetical protein EU539_08265 [Promethearchaeota archaeon]|nr:MAG: hypothetical protein EU539_08265 [Candidatus Lokiarchaeota archaeon]